MYFGKFEYNEEIKPKTMGTTKKDKFYKEKPLEAFPPDLELS